MRKREKEETESIKTPQHTSAHVTVTSSQEALEAPSESESRRRSNRGSASQPPQQMLLEILLCLRRSAESRARQRIMNVMGAAPYWPRVTLNRAQAFASSKILRSMQQTKASIQNFALRRADGPRVLSSHRRLQTLHVPEPRIKRAIADDGLLGMDGN